MPITTNARTGEHADLSAVHSRPASPSAQGFRLFSLVGIFFALGLILLGWALIPATSPISVAGAVAVLVIYGVVFYFGVPRFPAAVLRWATLFGVIAGAVFVAEILLEYALLPKDNTGWGVAEFGIVFALYFLSSFWAAYRSRSFGAGLRTAVLSAMLSSLIWLIALLAVFYVFRGTERQARVFLAEGNTQDFAHSGAAAFDAFIMEDFLGGAFFHLLLGPAIAAVLGAVSGVIGKWMVRAGGNTSVHG